MSFATPVLELSEIEHKYSNQSGYLKVLDGINFTLYAGQIISIMGISGSGKSTFLSIAGLLMSPSRGKVKVCGYDISSWSDQEKTRFRMQNVGFVYQKHFLLRDFNVQENVMTPLILKGGLDYPGMSEVVKKLLLKFNIWDRCLHLPSQLSGGECQRVAIARGIVSLPKIILADEPTGNLDIENTKSALLYLKEIVKEHHLSCIIATHDPKVADMTDQIFYLKDGKL
jgi:ABC-type lipoprotein export system ATPase subunit